MCVVAGIQCGSNAQKLVAERNVVSRLRINEGPCQSKVDQVQNVRVTVDTSHDKVLWFDIAQHNTFRMCVFDQGQLYCAKGLRLYNNKTTTRMDLTHHLLGQDEHSSQCECPPTELTQMRDIGPESIHYDNVAILLQSIPMNTGYAWVPFQQTMDGGFVWQHTLAGFAGNSEVHFDLDSSAATSK